MASNPDFSECTDARRSNCLMLRPDGKCNGLRDTEECTFFKDKRSMQWYQVEEYWNEDWGK